MTASEIFNLRAADFVSSNNLRGLLQSQSAAVNANPCDAVKIVAVFNHGKGFSVEDMHSAKLVSHDGEKFVLSVAQVKMICPANVRAIFFIQAA